MLSSDTCTSAPQLDDAAYAPIEVPACDYFLDGDCDQLRSLDIRLVQNLPDLHSPPTSSASTARTLCSRPSTSPRRRPTCPPPGRSCAFLAAPPHRHGRAPLVFAAAAVATAAAHALRDGSQRRAGLSGLRRALQSDGAARQPDGSDVVDDDERALTLLGGDAARAGAAPAGLMDPQHWGSGPGRCSSRRLCLCRRRSSTTSIEPDRRRSWTVSVCPIYAIL